MIVRPVALLLTVAVAAQPVLAQTKSSASARKTSKAARTDEPIAPVADPGKGEVPGATADATTAPVLPTPDVPANAEVTAAVPPAVAAVPAAGDAAAAVPPAATEGAPIRAAYTLDTPIQVLIANPATKAVLDRDLPGVSDDENLDKFQALSLRSFQPMTGGQLTDAMLAKVAADLDKLAGGSGTVITPLKLGNAKRSKDTSR